MGHDFARTTEIRPTFAEESDVPALAATPVSDTWLRMEPPVETDWSVSRGSANSKTQQMHQQTHRRLSRPRIHQLPSHLQTHQLRDLHLPPQQRALLLTSSPVRQALLHSHQPRLKVYSVSTSVQIISPAMSYDSCLETTGECVDDFLRNVLKHALTYVPGIGQCEDVKDTHVTTLLTFSD
jgi:hypothetical protein